MFVKNTREPELQNLREVCRLLSPSASEREAILDKMRTLDDERFLELANELEDMSENLRKSVYSVANSHMQPWRDERIAAATSSTASEWDPELVYENMHLEERMASVGAQEMGPRIEENGMLIRGMVHSIFLILPPSELVSYGSVLRVILGLHIIGIQKKSAELQKGETPFRPSRSVLFLLDELPQLGYMKILENAVAIARSAGIKLWFFTQDLFQLKHTYPKWESILSNCKVQIFFKPGDLGTAEYLSRRLGLRKDIMGGKSPLASPQQLMGADFEDKVIVLKSGTKPIKAIQPTMFFEDPVIQEFIALEKTDARAVPQCERKTENKPKNK
jgi:type IV secretion system protein VirD4